MTLEAKHVVKQCAVDLILLSIIIYLYSAIYNGIVLVYNTEDCIMQ